MCMQCGANANGMGLMYMHVDDVDLMNMRCGANADDVFMMIMQ